VVSAARTAIDMERAHQNLDAIDAACYPHVDDQQVRHSVRENLYQRTGRYWEPTLPQVAEIREAQKVSAADLAFINSMI
jgi:DNA replication initiation complex subunit (GINS family)